MTPAEEPIGPKSLLAQRFRGFLPVVVDDARKSCAAIELVLAQDGISSELVDNLNASIHLRALLTDLFLFDLDGTLADSKKDLAAAINHTLKNLDTFFFTFFYFDVDFDIIARPKCRVVKSHLLFFQLINFFHHSSKYLTSFILWVNLKSI